MPDQRVTVGAMLEQWLSDVLPGTVAKATEGQYRDVVRLYIKPRIGDKKLRDLTPTDVTRMLRDTERPNPPRPNGYSQNSRRLARSVLRRAIRWAEVEGIVSRNVAALANPVRVERPDGRTMTPAQARIFLDHIKGDRNEALFVTALSLGLRVSELLLREFSGGAVNTPKLVNYGTGANPANKVFKQSYNVSDIPKAKQPNAPSMTGIDLQNSQISRRAVATSKMDKMLGTNVVPKTSFATHGGVSGSVMDQISGKEVKELATAGEVEALYKKPSIKRGMYNAQTLDYFTGEPDRHWANLMIDTERDEVQLHDNEFAQGVHTQPFDKQPASLKAGRMNMDAVGSPALGSHRKGARARWISPF